MAEIARRGDLVPHQLLELLHFRKAALLAPRPNQLAVDPNLEDAALIVGNKSERAEFLAKLGIVVEEADETVFWVELLEETGILFGESLSALKTEANELLAIFAASQVTTRSNNASLKK